MHPAWFFVYGVAVFVFFLLGFLRVRAQWRLVEQRLSVPAKASPPSAPRPATPVFSRPGARRDGQLPPLTAAGQERWARAALRDTDGRVQVAPVRCPLGRDQVGTTS